MNKKTDLRYLRTVLESYIEKGFYLLPCYEKDKKPIINDYQSNSTQDIERCMEWAKKYPNCNWAILPNRSGHIVIDIDTKDGGLEYWEALTLHNGDPVTWIQRTGSGGLHYVFKSKPGATYRAKLKKGVGIDIRFKNYIVVYPSIHENGNQYHWLSDDDFPICDVPTWVLDLCEKRSDRSERDIPKLQTGIEYFKPIAAQLREKEFDYPTWVQIGMAIHSLFPDGAGLDLWKYITEGVNFQEGDLEQCDYKWDGFSEREDGVTARTFLFIARQFDCDIPNPLLQQDRELFAETEGKRIEIEAEENPGWFMDGNHMVCVHEDFIVDWMNEQGYVIMTQEPAGVVFHQYVDKYGVKQAAGIKIDGLKLLLADKSFKYYVWGPRKGYEAKYKSIVDVWVEAVGRKTSTKVVFQPVAHPNELNLWDKIPCTAIPGDTSLFHELIDQVISKGNKEKAKWFKQWLAHIVQKPEQKSTIVPVLIGDQGNGKGLITEGVMAKILGPFFNKIMTAQTLKERFNEEQAKKFLTFIDEATWRGDKVEDGILKSLTGSAEMTVEAKFGARYRLNNYSRYIIASNNPEAVAIERSNRRYIVFEVNPAYCNRLEFFGPFWDALKNGTLASHIYHELMTTDISDFKPFLLPKFDNEAGNMKIATEGVVAQFWHEVLFHSPKELFPGGDFLPRDWAYDEFLGFAQTIKSWEKGITRSVFWSRSEKLIPCLKVGESRKRLESGRLRGFAVTPNQVMESFCASLGLEANEEFDDLDYFFESEFKKDA